MKYPKPSDNYDVEVFTGNFQEIETRLKSLESGTGGTGGTGTTVSARISEIVLIASKWVGASSPYSQIVTVEGVTENSQVDLTPSAAQLSVFWEKDLTFVTENENGVVTVYAIGQKPTSDYIIQCTITEVIYG